MVSTGLASLTAVAPTKSNDPLAWMDRAACVPWDFKKHGDPFYPDSAAPAAAIEGKRICRRCPVIQECYVHSTENVNTRRYGTFGGLSEAQRKTRAQLEHRAKAKDQP